MTKFVKDLKHKKRGIVLKDIQPMEKKKKSLFFSCRKAARAYVVLPLHSLYHNLI